MKRNGAPLTDNEKLMVINVYHYFSGDNLRKDDHRKLTLRKRVAEVLGIGEGTVGSIVSDWNKRGDNTFTPHKALGRRKSEPSEDVSELLRTKILECNKKAEQLNTPILRQFLSENGYELSKWKLLRLLHRLGYYFGQGERRNILHESPNNVACSGPHPNLLSVRNTLLDAFKKKITSHVIIGFWKKALKHAKEYLEYDDNAQLTDDEFDEYSSSDDDHVI
jgi:transposase